MTDFLTLRLGLKSKLLAKGKKKMSAMIDPNDGSGFVVLSDVVPDIIQEIRYFSTYNFMGRRIRGYEQPIALMTKEAADAVAKANAVFQEKGYVIKVFDTYRPTTAVEFFCEWENDMDDQIMKEAFFPDVDKKTIFEEGFISRRSGHSRGSTIDLTLVDKKTGVELDMGGVFDFFGAKSYALYKDITEEQKANRMLLRETMIEAGFRPITSEWWHFVLVDEPYPDTYFSFPVNTASLKKPEVEVDPRIR